MTKEAIYNIVAQYNTENPNDELVILTSLQFEDYYFIGV